MFRILLVEDEENLLNAIKLNLELDGYQVVAVTRGKQALKEFKQAKFHLVILDVMLPEISGFDICESIRIENALVPILFLTAKGGTDDKVKGLRLGADDYLTKPFNLEEFLLRVKRLLARNSIITETKPFVLSEIYSFGDNEINFLTYEIKGIGGRRQQISKREIQLLKLLIERNNEVVSREKILETIWGYDVYPSTRTIDNYILAFRKYFEQNPKAPQYFHSIRGVGYKFTG